MKLFTRKPVSRPSPPMLQTERLVLRAFDENDAVDVYAYSQSPKPGRTANRPPRQSPEETRALMQTFLNRGDAWAAVEKKSGRVVGCVTLGADARREMRGAREIGYAPGESDWGQGYALEALREVMRYAFLEDGCRLLSAAHFPENAGDRRVIRKLGFVYEGTLRLCFAMPDGTFADQALYSMTEQEYRTLGQK